MTESLGDGLFQKVPSGTINVRLRVPRDLYGQRRPDGSGVYRSEVTKSTRTKILEIARDRGRIQQARWKAEFEKARGLVGTATLEHARLAIEEWRQTSCAGAAGIGYGATSAREVDLNALAASVVIRRLAWRDPPPHPALISVKPSLHYGGRAYFGDGDDDDSLDIDVFRSARRFFERNPGVSRNVAMPTETAMLLGRLQVASRDPSKWCEIPDFDFAMVQAVKLGGVAAPLSEQVQHDLRTTFVHAWREVLQHEEAERRRAATMLAAIEVQQLQPAAIQVAGDAVYKAREGDITVGELVTRYEAFRTRVKGEKWVKKNLAHIFRTLEEIVGKDKPARSVTVDDAEAVRDFIKSLPSSATKKWKGRKLSEVVEIADALDENEDDPSKLVPRLAPATINQYMLGFSQMWKWAAERKTGRYFVDSNVAAGLRVPEGANVKRRGFEKTELETVFAALRSERTAQSWRWWVPAIACFSGMRAGEIAQLTTSDLHFQSDPNGGDPIPYFKLAAHGPDGRRSTGMDLKTPRSARNVPIHPELVDAGLLTWIEQRHQGRLFPELKQNGVGSWSDQLSRWFASHLDGVGLIEPALTFHSFRHGFSDAGKAAGVDRDIRRALGGWATEDVAEEYGDRYAVIPLAAALARYQFHGFRLAN